MTARERGRFGVGRPIAEVAAEVAKIANADERRSVRIAIKEEALLFRLQGRRYEGGSKLADTVAKFGGGSLLTATLLLIVGGQAGSAVTATAILTLLLFVAGTMFGVYFDRRAAQWEFLAEWLEAVLKETER